MSYKAFFVFLDADVAYGANVCFDGFFWFSPFACLPIGCAAGGRLARGPLLGTIVRRTEHGCGLRVELATTFTALFVGRFFCGVGRGGAILVGSMYISEFRARGGRGGEGAD